MRNSHFPTNWRLATQRLQRHTRWSANTRIVKSYINVNFGKGDPQKTAQMKTLYLFELLRMERAPPQMSQKQLKQIHIFSFIFSSRGPPEKIEIFSSGGNVKFQISCSLNRLKPWKKGNNNHCYISSGGGTHEKFQLRKTHILIVRGQTPYKNHKTIKIYITLVFYICFNLSGG